MCVLFFSDIDTSAGRESFSSSHYPDAFSALDGCVHLVLHVFVNEFLPLAVGANQHGTAISCIRMTCIALRPDFHYLVQHILYSAFLRHWLLINT